MSNLTPEAIDAMLAAGLTAEQICSVVKAQLAAEARAVAAADEARRAAKREAATERQRRKREKDKARTSVTHVTRDNDMSRVTERDIPPSSPPQYKLINPPPLSPHPKSSDLGESAGEPASAPADSSSVRPVSKAKVRKPETRIDPDREPDHRDQAFVADRGIPASQAKHEWDKFVAFHAAKGTLMVDWNAAWRTWVLRCQDRPPPPAAPVRKKSVQDAAQDLLNQFRSEASHDDRILTLPTRNRPATDEYFDGLLSARRG